MFSPPNLIDLKKAANSCQIIFTDLSQQEQNPRSEQIAKRYLRKEPFWHRLVEVFMTEEMHILNDKTNDSPNEIPRLRQTLTHSIILILFFGALFSVSSQSPDTAWSRQIAGFGFPYATSECVEQTVDGGFIIAGFSYDLNHSMQYQGIVTKTDAMGRTQWERYYGDSVADDYLLSGQQTEDGGFVFSGTADNNIWLLRLNSLGNIVWSKTFGGGTSYSVTEIPEGGFILGATNGWTIEIFRISATGSVIWQRNYLGKGGTCDICKTATGYVALATQDNGFPNGSDIWLLGLNSNGDTVWTKTYGGTEDDWASSLVLLSDGGFLIGGTTASFAKRGLAVWLLRTDPAGDTLWSRIIDGDSSNCQEIRRTSDGGYIYTGSTYSTDLKNYALSVVKTDSMGDCLWARTYGDSNGGYGSSICQTNDGGFAVAGARFYFKNLYANGWLLKLNSAKSPFVFSLPPKSSAMRGSLSDNGKAFDILGRRPTRMGAAPQGLYLILDAQVTSRKQIRLK